MAQSISQEAIAATGIPGAQNASRHVGATTSGAPTTGTFAVGDYIIGQDGSLWICTTAGTPGSWVRAGQGANPTGRIYSAAGTSLTGSANTTITFGTSGALTGGMTHSGNTLVVPITGYYQVNAIVTVSPAANLWTTIQVAGLSASYTSENGSGYVHQVNDIIYAIAGQGISINCYNWGATFTTADQNFLSAALVGQ